MCQAIRYQKAERLSRALEIACKVGACKARDCKIQEEQGERLMPVSPQRPS